ncbi:MAG: bestrophin family ion channel, partial [Myxococcota bacterium]
MNWSRDLWLGSAIWSAAVTAAYSLLGWTWLAIPWLPVASLATAVAFYLGFKTNQSYDRLWEARKIWGAIVNASRSWAFTARDMVSDQFHGHGEVAKEELHRHRETLVRRHVAWMDAFRHQLRSIKSWEHRGERYDRLRGNVPERNEELSHVLDATLSASERDEVLSKINPAAHLLANQSRHLGELREKRLIDGFSHMELQKILIELMAQQGKAERIKNFPLPRQYSTVNFFFAVAFCGLVPLGMLHAFSAHFLWMAIPFSSLVSW